MSASYRAPSATILRSRVPPCSWPRTQAAITILGGTATRGNRIAGLLAALALAGLTGCVPGFGDRPAGGPARGPQVEQDLVRTFRVCLAAAPQSWTDAFRKRTVALPDGAEFGLGAVSPGGELAFGQYRTRFERGIGSVDLGSGRLTKLTAYPAAASGLGWMVAEPAWVVWQQGDAANNPAAWSLHAWNRQSGEHLVLASSRLPDGTYVPGPPAIPAIRQGRVAWAHPLAGPASAPQAEVRILDLARRLEAKPATGRVGWPVFAGPYLVWARIGEDGAASFQAVEADTLRSVELPARLRSPGPVASVAGSARYLAWSPDGLGELSVWRPGTREYGRYVSPDPSHRFQFPKLAGRHLLWSGGATSSVLDLESGNGFDVQGSVAGSEELIVKSEPARPPANRSEVVASRLSMADAATSIEPCGP